MRVSLPAAVLAAMLLTACTPAGEPDARAAAEQFQVAVAGGDLSAACAMLSDRARRQLEGTTATGCVQALSRLTLSDASVSSVSVWGDNAQARLADGALFLSEFDTGWQVTAAGCTYVSDELPYECAVEG